jgi:hypothetical protein
MAALVRRALIFAIWAPSRIEKSMGRELVWERLDDKTRLARQVRKKWKYLRTRAMACNGRFHGGRYGAT